jgi:hypothetical protein
MDLQIDISLELWKGNIPIELVVAAHDQTSSAKLSSCFIFVSRMSYLNVVAADSVDYLKAFAIDLASDVWFESNGSPLKWYCFFLDLMLHCLHFYSFLKKFISVLDNLTIRHNKEITSKSS